MKRYHLILLSLGLILTFGASAFAADVKFNGEYYLQGWYVKNHSLVDKDDSASSVTNRGSSAFYTQRLKIGTEFKVAKGLKLVTRFTALERKWMAARRTAGTSSPGKTASDSEAENIAFDVAYLDITTPIGKFTIGDYPSTKVWGPAFGDSMDIPSAQINWLFGKGMTWFTLNYKKSNDGLDPNSSYPTGTAIGTGTAYDNETVTASITQFWSTGAFGAAIWYTWDDTSSYPGNATATNLSFKYRMPGITTWVQQRFGKILIEDEVNLVPFGDFVKYNDPSFGAYASYYPDIEADMAWSNFFNIKIDLAPATAGFMFVYARGDDPATNDKREGGFRRTNDADRAFNPCLILFNEDYMHWIGGGKRGWSQNGTLVGNAGWNTHDGQTNGISTYFDNVWFYQIYGDFKVTPKLTITASYSYAYADKKPTDSGYPVGTWMSGSSGYYQTKEFVSDKYGSELDITMKYKIFDNLEYMIGAAYLWTGDYFKGTNDNVKLSDNYLITHKLTLKF